MPFGVSETFDWLSDWMSVLSFCLIAAAWLSGTLLLAYWAFVTTYGGPVRTRAAIAIASLAAMTAAAVLGVLAVT